MHDVRLSGAYNFDEFDLANQQATDPVVDPQVSKWGILWGYIFKLSNVIDFASIMPHFIVILMGGGESMSFLRVFQLGRILRAGKNNQGIEILSRTLRSSQRELSMLLFYILLGVVVSASLVYIFEKGEFEVTHTYPEGEFLRATVDMQSKAPTPFVSIWASMYWSLVTATTLGYGDMYPTTPAGRCVSSVWIVCGILVPSA
jgi:voltage-gated potassium channel Kch